MFIKEIVESKDIVTVITRFRRMGKTTMLSVLRHFLQYKTQDANEPDLFEEYEISSHKEFCEKHKGKY